MSATNESRRNLLAGFFAAISGGFFLRKADAQPLERDDAGYWEVADDCEVREEHFVYDSIGCLIERIVVYRD